MRFLRWIFSLFVPATGCDVYRPSERIIYRYHDGTKWVRADPMVLWKRLMERGPAISIDTQVASSPSKDAKKAHDALIANIRLIFDLAPLNEGGLTEQESADLLDHFLIYTQSLKKKANLLPTLSNSAAASKTSTVAGHPMPPSLDSGCAVNDSCSAEPTQRPLEPESLLESIQATNSGQP